MTTAAKMQPRGLPAISSSTSSGTESVNNMPTPTNANMADRLAQIDSLKYFLATATENWEDNAAIKRFRLPTGEDMSCVLWNDLFYITGTDIVRSLTFRFHAFGRPVANAKKFEEGIFSDLRNLKPGNDARLEEPKSELLDMLYKNNCIRTQKKQKVFYWYSVPHDRLFLDALERDLKREKMDMEPTTVAVAEPASSLSLDSTQELFDQLRKSMSLSAAATAHALEDEAARCTVPHAQGYWGWLPHQRNRSAAPAGVVNSKPATTAPARRSRVNSVPATTPTHSRHHYHHLSHAGHAAAPQAPVRPRVRSRATTPSSPAVARQRLSPTVDGRHATYAKLAKPPSPKPSSQPMARAPGRDQPAVRRQSSDSSKSLDSNALRKKKAIFGTLSLFDGSPTYKQRRRRAASTSSATPNATTAPTATVPPPPNAAAYSLVHPPPHHHQMMDPATAIMQQQTYQPPVPVKPVTPTQQYDHHNSSRLAMAAAAVGFVPQTGAWQPVMDAKMEPERTYTCPQPNCERMFKLLEHLDHHLRAHEMDQPFMCPMCAKRFTHSEFLMEHQKTHNDMFDEAKGNDCACSTPSWQTAAAAAASAGLCTTTPSNTSSDNSRCSTLSPMLDLDNFYDQTNFQIRSRTNSSCEDDSSSSLTSSPSSAIHFNQQLPQHPYHHHQPQLIDDVCDTATFMFNAADRYYARPPVTLFSSFKPELFQQQQQPHQSMPFLSPGAFQYDAGAFQQQEQYVPFVAPTDVSMAMM